MLRHVYEAAAIISSHLRKTWVVLKGHGEEERKEKTGKVEGDRTLVSSDHFAR